MRVSDICEAENFHGISDERVQRALANMQAKGLISGFVPDDPDADIVLTRAGIIFMQENNEDGKGVVV